MLTKKLIYQGNIMPVKQCMPEGIDIEVETVDLDNQSADEPMRTKRWLFNVRTVLHSNCHDTMDTIDKL